MPYMKVTEHYVQINLPNVNKLCIGVCCMSTYCRAADVTAVMLGSSLGGSPTAQSNAQREKRTEAGSDQHSDLSPVSHRDAPSGSISTLLGVSPRLHPPPRR